MFLLFALIVREFIKASWVLLLPTISIHDAKFLFFTLFTLQLIFAIVQGGISDHFCRKKSLLFAFFSITIAQFFLFLGFNGNFAFLIIGILVNGMFGNIPALARAAIYDIKLFNNIHISLSFSFFILPIPWILWLTLLFFIPINELAQLLILASIILSIICFLLIYYKFEDNRDFDPHPEIQKYHNYFIQAQRFYKKLPPLFLLALKFIQVESKNIKNLFQKSYFSIGIFAFWLSQIGFQLIFYFLDEHNGFFSQKLNVNTIIFIGFGIGTLFLVCLRKQEKLGIVLGNFFAGLVLLLMNLFHFTESTTLSLFFIGMFGLSAGIFLPSFYIHFSESKPIHEKGKLLGLLDSTQTLGEMSVAYIFLLWKENVDVIERIPSIIIFLLVVILFLISLRIQKSYNKKTVK